MWLYYRTMPVSNVHPHKYFGQLKTCLWVIITQYYLILPLLVLQEISHYLKQMFTHLLIKNKSSHVFLFLTHTQLQNFTKTGKKETQK